MLRNLEEKKLGNILIVDINVETATLENAKSFKEYLSRRIEEGSKNFIIDLTKVGYMDSTFLGSLVFSLKKTVAEGGDLKLVLEEMDSPVWTMFETTRMFKVFKTFPDVGTAVKSF